MVVHLHGTLLFLMIAIGQTLGQVYTNERSMISTNNKGPVNSRNNKGPMPCQCAEVIDYINNTGSLESEYLSANRHRSMDYIINGQTIERRPYYVGVGFAQLHGPYDIYFRCGGTLLSHRYILTAAHCVEKLPNLKGIPLKWMVRLDMTERLK